MKKVIILGSGITGLAAGYFLRKRKLAGEAIDFQILESSARVGGKIITDRVDNGFVVEGGPDSFVTEKPACLDLCHELGLGPQLIPSNEIQRKVYVLRNGKLVAFPSGFRLTIPTEIKPFLLSPLISPLGKLRMGFDYFIPPRQGDGDVSLADFIGRRLGKECVDNIAGPMMAGIFVSDPYRMSMKGTFPMFLGMEQKYGSLIKAAMHAKKNPRPPNPKAAGGAMFNSLKGGMNTLVDSLYQQVKDQVVLNQAVVHLERQDNAWLVRTAHGGSFTADAIIIALPAWKAATIVRDQNARLAGMLDSIRYLSTATVSMAYYFADLPPEKQLDGFGVLTPARENRKIIACTWSSVKFKHRAPDGAFLLRSFVGGHPREELAGLPDEPLLHAVREEYRDLFGLTVDPIFHRIYRWQKSNPQYDVGHLDRVAQMETLAAETHGLLLAGSAFHGIGMPDCIKSAQSAVSKI